MPREQVLAWLEKTGFPLEMIAARAFREVGFEVQQSTTYIDSATDKSREIDVLANDPDLMGFVDLSVVVECKSSAKPWVVLMANDALAGYNRLRVFAVMSDPARIALTRGMIDDLKVASMLHAGGRCGYALRQAFSKEDDPAYAAAMGLISACVGIIPKESFGGWPVVKVVIPVLIVDAPLFECELQPDGNLLLTEVEMSEFLFSAHVPQHVMCLVRVARKSKLKAIATWANQAMVSLRSDLAAEESRIIKALDAKAKSSSAPRDA
jgi:hypothetical protein